MQLNHHLESCSEWVDEDLINFISLVHHFWANLPHIAECESIFEFSRAFLSYQSLLDFYVYVERSTVRRPETTFSSRWRCCGFSLNFLFLFFFGYGKITRNVFEKCFVDLGKLNKNVQAAEKYCCKLLNECNWTEKWLKWG